MGKIIWKKPQFFFGDGPAKSVLQWLLFEGSFTIKVQSLNGLNEKFAIRILKEDLSLLKGFVCDLNSSNYLYTRDIQIFLGEKLLMFANSVVPKNANLIFKKKFRSLGERSLGNLLFSYKDMVRSSFELAKVMPDTTEFKLATLSSQEAPPFLWARRSHFSLQERCLTLVEVFSPELINLINQSV